jgi:hypothetical protein
VNSGFTWERSNRCNASPENKLATEITENTEKKQRKNKYPDMIRIRLF